MGTWPGGVLYHTSGSNGIHSHLDRGTGRSTLVGHYDPAKALRLAASPVASRVEWQACTRYGPSPRAWTAPKRLDDKEELGNKVLSAPCCPSDRHRVPISGVDCQNLEVPDDRARVGRVRTSSVLTF